MPGKPIQEEEWETLDDEGNLIEPFKYIELEFLFTSDIEGTHISEMVASIVEEFDTRIAEAEIVLDKDDPEEMRSPGEGGVALYDIYPNKPGLLEAFQERLKGFDVEITIWPTKGM